MKKVFLGGTCNESDWRDRIIPALQIDYFNPVVDDWTPAHLAAEVLMRDRCDFCLYVITPIMTGVYAIAEVVDDSNKRPEKTIFVPLLNDKDLTFDAGQWKSVNAVRRLVEANGAQVFGDLLRAAYYMNNH